MRRERRTELLLIDILAAADTVAEALDRLQATELSRDKVLEAAVVGSLIRIGEAANRLPAEFQSAHPDVGWPAIVGFRHVMVHAYEHIDESVLDTVARERVPELRQQLLAVLGSEYPLVAQALDEHNGERS